MHECSDVIVVGAGPAGSMAAAVLARHGVRVLLLDREQFPRDKACGDVVPMNCFLELHKIGLHTGNLDRFPIQRITLEGTIGGSQHAQRTFDLAQQPAAGGPLSTCVVSRMVFDGAMFQHALACGAGYQCVNVRGPVLENGQVTGVTGTAGGRKVHYYSRIVIGADGATSVIARGLGSRRKNDDQWAVALRGYVDTDVNLDATIRLAFLDEIQPGYAWFFPIEPRRANVGVGMRSDFYKRQKRSLNDLLAGYLARSEIAAHIGRNRVKQLQAWPIPFFIFEKQRVFDGALLAGDAGGFVHPITAAGIFPAIMSGKCAAEAAIQALETGNVTQTGLSCYTDLWQDVLAADFKPAVTAGKLATLFPHLVSAALLLSGPESGSSSGSHSSLLSSLGKF